MKEDKKILSHLFLQANILEKKADNLLKASQTLRKIIYNDKSTDWEIIIKTIKVYNMAQEQEKDWIQNILTSDELKKYSEFKANLDPQIKKNFFIKWDNLINKIKLNITQDPKSNFGAGLAKECITLINDLYGSKYADLKHTIWENGLKKTESWFSF